MNLRASLIAVFAALLVVGAWLALRPPQLDPIPDVTAGSTRHSAPRAAAPASATVAVPTARVATPLQSRIPNIAMPAPAPTLFNEYLRARSYKALYERLANSPEGQTAEGRLTLYEILRQCATITEGRRPGFKPTPPKREEFINSIPATDPQRDQRIAAFDQYATDACAGLEGVTMKRADLMQMLNDAAAAGDPRARALAMEQELWQARRGGRDGGVTLTDEQIASLRQIAGTRDPEAIRVAGRVLGNSWQDYQVRVGPDQLPIEQRAFMNAWLVLSCEFGAPCGTDTPRMLQACALQGHCNAQSYPEHLYYYGSTPHDSTLLTQYREVLRQAIETGNWSQVAVVRGVPPTGNRMTFVPGPR
ncbi:MAG: hypothetical protein ABIR98_08625 [Usitatibacter sp.]